MLPRSAVSPKASPAADRTAILAHYERVRTTTLDLAATIGPEDQVVQSMPDASPTKWHLAHTTWFFETLVLARFAPDYRLFDERWGFLFNSYYETLGERHPRPRRGLLTRPTVAEVQRYRQHVDAALLRLIDAEGDQPDLAARVELGLHHEQQHQELVLTDIKHLFAQNPLAPIYAERPGDPPAPAPAPAPAWHAEPGGLVEIGHDGTGFAYDNEGPHHRVWLEPFHLATRPVTCGTFLAFMADGGYRTPTLWLSDGWALVQAEGWQAPLYWRWQDGGWFQFTLAGLRPVDPAEPVCHISFYEADACARWAGARLPTEAEWEIVAARHAAAGNLLDTGRFHPLPVTGNALENAVGNAAASPPVLERLFGDVWEWTQSAYAPYPGYRPPPGAIGEYNGKFMHGPMVLRGGSCATPADHIRATYRNFFPAAARWQFSGCRLARDA